MFFGRFSNIYSGFWCRQCLYAEFLSVSLFARRAARWQIGHPQILQSSEKKILKKKTLFLINTLKRQNKCFQRISMIFLVGQGALTCYETQIQLKINNHSEKEVAGVFGQTTCTFLKLCLIYNIWLTLRRVC